jgi:hypothetical protein
LLQGDYQHFAALKQKFGGPKFKDGREFLAVATR